MSFMLTSDHLSFSLKQYSDTSPMCYMMRLLTFISIHFSFLSFWKEPGTSFLCYRLGMLQQGLLHLHKH